MEQASEGQFTASRRERTLFGINNLVKIDTIKEDSQTYKNERDVVFQMDASKVNQSLIKIEFCTANTFILLSNGEVYSKGKGEALGRQKKENNKVFEEVLFETESENYQNLPETNLRKDLEGKILIYDISAGNNHVLVLDNNHVVWGWGDNNYHQILPRSNIKNFDFPQMIDFNKNVFITQVFANYNSSFVVGSKNCIISWGEINTKSQSRDKVNDNSNDFMFYDEMAKIIDYVVFKDTSDYTENFIKFRKSLNSRFWQNSKEEEEKKKKIEKLMKKLKVLQIEIEKRQKENKQFNNYLASKINDRKVLILKDLLQQYEKKMNKTSSKKEDLRKSLSKIEGEINKENSDMANNVQLIDEVETEIENLYNKITIKETKGENIKEKSQTVSELSSIRVRPTNQSDENKELEEKKNEEIIEIQKQIHNKEIFKESLNKNLQVISSSLDSKEKERSLIVSSINKVTDKENSYLQARNIIEDMIQVLFDAINRQNMQKNFTPEDYKMLNANTKNLHSKIRETYNKLLALNEQSEKISFISIHIAEPFKLTQDILNDSNEKIESIREAIDRIKAQQTETVKNDLKIIYQLIETKLNLIDEQNKMIKIIHVLLSSLKENDVKLYFQDKNKVKESMLTSSTVKDDVNDNIEYIYKDIIINLLKETYWLIKEEEKLIKMDAEGSREKQDKYIEDKVIQMKKLKERTKVPEQKKVTEDIYDNCVSFNCKNEPDTKFITGNTSSWNWNYSFKENTPIDRKQNTPTQT